ncbi:MAG: type II toxin-antitoxin system HicA family toxin [Gammaproteobacteria bacterium]|nr:type II toxin-antitoxin system HicA family toxin [Gammaproteobacteria bacterium]
MNSKHRKTRAELFTDPVNGSMKWSRIESLLVAAGCTLIEGSGSSVTFAKNGKKLTIHRPHPGDDALKYRIKLVREFLQQLGDAP